MTVDGAKYSLDPKFSSIKAKRKGLEVQMARGRARDRGEKKGLMEGFYSFPDFERALREAKVTRAQNFVP